MKTFLKKISVVLLAGTLALQPAAVADFCDVITVEAHSGRTDSSGGHKDNKNKSGLGSYHYHCGGNPAHLHTNGVCPYSSNDSSASSSASSTVSGGGSFGGEASASGSSISSSISISGKSVELSNGETADLSKDLMKIVQDVLNQKGYECGTPDGIIGSKTQKALKEFLEDNEDEADTDYLIISMIAVALDIES